MSEGPFRAREPDDSPPPAPRRPTPPPAPVLRSSATWIAGALAALIILYISLNSIRTEGPGSRGVPPDRPLPPFAVPLAVSDLDGDANISRQRGQGARRAACEVRGPKILNVCELAEQGPVVLVFFAEPSDRCKQQVDVVDRAARRFPAMRMAAVSVRGNRDKVRRAIRERGWRIPVGFDRDGAVANNYAVSVCPMLTFARAGGLVDGTSLSFLDDAALERRLRSLR